MTLATISAVLAFVLLGFAATSLYFNYAFHSVRRIGKFQGLSWIYFRKYKDVWFFNTATSLVIQMPPRGRHFFILHIPWCRHQWKHFPRYWPFVRGIRRSKVNSPHKGQWRGALMLSFICAWINGWVNNRDAGGLRRHCAHYDVIVMQYHDCGRTGDARSHSISSIDLHPLWRNIPVSVQEGLLWGV